MGILYHADSAVKVPRTPLRPIRYLVPGTEHDQHPRTAAIGYPDAGILRSVRTRGGRHYGNNSFNVNCEVLDQAEADGLTTVEIVITYQRAGVTVTYSTSIETLRAQGQRVMGESGWELALPRQLWSVDGAAPEGLPKAQPAPVAAQPALFDFAEPRKVVYF